MSESACVASERRGIERRTWSKVIGEDRLVNEPRRVRLRVSQTRVVPHDTDEDRRARHLAFMEETKRILKDVPVKEVNESNPLFAKFKRMGVLEVRP